MADDDEEYEVESILDRQLKKGKYYYVVKWKGYEETTLEPEENLTNCQELIARYLELHPPKSRRRKSGHQTVKKEVEHSPKKEVKKEIPYIEPKKTVEAPPKPESKPSTPRKSKQNTKETTPPITPERKEIKPVQLEKPIIPEPSTPQRELKINLSEYELRPQLKKLADKPIYRSPILAEKNIKKEDPFTSDHFVLNPNATLTPIQKYEIEKHFNPNVPFPIECRPIIEMRPPRIKNLNDITIVGFSRHSGNEISWKIKETNGEIREMTNFAVCNKYSSQLADYLEENSAFRLVE